MCAMLVFFVIGSHEPARIEPIKTTLEQAYRYLDGSSLNWPRGVYPVIKLCPGEENAD